MYTLLGLTSLFTFLFSEPVFQHGASLVYMQYTPAKARVDSTRVNELIEAEWRLHV